MKTSLVAVLTVVPLLVLSTLSACGDETPPGEGSGGAHSGGSGGTSSGGISSGGMDQGGNGGEGGAGTRDVTVTFRGQVGDEAFACGTEYAGQGLAETTVTPRDFRFFVSDLRLVTADGDEVQVAIAERSPFQASGVALIDFEDASEGCADGNAAMNDEITGTVPSGDYVGAVFSLSVPEELNHGNPATAPAPLQAGGLSWGWLMGYRFFVAELAEVDGTGIGLFHLGSTGCDNSSAGQGGAGGEGGAGPDYGSPPTVACAESNRPEIHLEDFDVDEDVIVADIGAALADVDLSTMSMCHGSGDACGPLFATVGLGTDDEQTVFRVERE